MIKKIIASIIFLFIVFSYLTYDKLQFKQTVADRAYSSLSRIHNFVGSNDLIFIPKFNNQYTAIITALRYFFNFNVFVTDNSNEIRSLLLENHDYFLNHYQNFYVFSDYPLSNNDWLNFVANIPYQQGEYSLDAGFPPKKFYYNQSNFYLYQIKLEPIRHLAFQQSGNFILDQHAENLVNFNLDRAWSKGCSQITNIDYSLNSKPMVLQINLKSGRQNWQNPHTFNLQLVANGNQPLQLINVGKLNYQFSLPASIQTLNTLTICTHPFIPKLLGHSKDGRTLGLNIWSIQIIPAIKFPIGYQKYLTKIF
jgi:hypothetical protein